MPGIGVGSRIGRRMRRGITAPPPFAAGAKVMVIGHSFVTANHSTSPDRSTPPLTNITSKLVGDGVWLQALDSRFNIDTWADIAAPYKVPIVNNDVMGACNGFSGASLFDLATNAPMLAHFVAHAPDIVVFNLGTNDITGGQTLANMTAYATTMMDAFQANGTSQVVYLTVWPRVASGGVSPIPDGDGRLTTLVNFNNYLRGLVGVRPRFSVADVAAVVADGTGYRPSESYWLSNDGLHPQDRGVYESAKVLLPILRSLVAPGAYAPINPDPTAGNLTPNAAMTGTGGTKATAGAPPLPTGNVPDGFSVTNFTGTSQVACSIEAGDYPGYNKLVLTITPVNDGTSIHEIRIAQTAVALFSTLGIAVGDWLRFTQRLEHEAWDGWRLTGATINIGSSAATLWSTSVDFPLNATLYDLPTEAMDRQMTSPPFQVVSGCDRLRINSGSPHLALRFRSDRGTTPRVIKISRPVLRKTASPKPAWNL